MTTNDDDEAEEPAEELATAGSVKDKGVAFTGRATNPHLRKGLGGGTPADPGKRVTPDVLRKKKGAPGYSGDTDTFTDWRELAQSMLDAAEGLDPSSDRKHYLAGIPAVRCGPCPR